VPDREKDQTFMSAAMQRLDKRGEVADLRIAAGDRRQEGGQGARECRGKTEEVGPSRAAAVSAQLLGHDRTRRRRGAEAPPQGQEAILAQLQELFGGDSDCQTRLDALKD
jgi:hypothetical protein